MKPAIYAESAYQQLRAEILNGELPAGTRLAETETARRLGFSQGPIREALSRLRADGLVISFTHRGSYVSEISIDEAQDAYRVRSVLERFALQLALPNMGNAEFRDLERMIENIESAAKARDLARNVACDMQFHRRAFEWSGSVTLLQLWENIEVKIRKFAIVATPPVFDASLVGVRDHYRLLEAMRQGYSRKLEEALDRHLALIWMTKNELAAALRDKVEAPRHSKDRRR